MKRYGFTKETKVVNGVTVHRIIALQDFYIADLNTPKMIERGTLGGWIEKEDNLEQEGLAWVSDEAVVYGDAVVKDAALACGEAEICGSTAIRDYARIYDSAKVGCKESVDYKYGLTIVGGHASVYGNASIINLGGNDLEICGYAEVYDNAEIHTSENFYVDLRDYAKVCGHAKMGEGNVTIKDYAVVTGYTNMGNDVTVCDHAVIDATKDFDDGTSAIGCSHTRIGGNAYIKSPCDYLTVGPFFTQRGDSSAYLDGDYITFSITSEGEVQFVRERRPIWDTEEPVFSLDNLDRLELRLRRSEAFHEATDLVIRIARAVKGYFDREREARDVILKPGNA